MQDLSVILTLAKLQLATRQLGTQLAWSVCLNTTDNQCLVGKHQIMSESYYVTQVTFSVCWKVGMPYFRHVSQYLQYVSYCITLQVWQTNPSSRWYFSGRSNSIIIRAYSVCGGGLSLHACCITRHCKCYTVISMTRALRKTTLISLIQLHTKTFMYNFNFHMRYNDSTEGIHSNDFAWDARLRCIHKTVTSKIIDTDC